MTESYPLCTSCNSKDVAQIFWGYPEESDSLKKKLKQKKIILGGCLVTDNDPKWECNACNHRWGERDDYDNGNNSFDFDQGFNLDEVYDQ